MQQCSCQACNACLSAQTGADGAWLYQTASRQSSQIADLQVSGIPTLMFVSGKDGSVVSYEGDRKEEDFVAFINKHSSAKSAGSASLKEEL